MSVVRPQPGPPPPYVPPDQATFRLDNGLRGTLVQVGSIPVASIRLVVHAGAVDVPADQTWLDRFVHDYLSEGTESLNSGALADAVASMGGRLRVESDEHTTVIRTEVLAEHAPAAVALLADVARRPRFPESEATRLLTDLRRNLDLILSQPQALAQDRFRRALYGDHPYGRVLATAAQLDRLDVDAVRGFWSGHAGADRARIMVAGRFDEEAVRDASEASFGGWAPATPSEPPPAEPSRRRAIHLVDRPGAEQTTLRIGLPVPDPTHEDYVALEVMNALLGGSFHSRITVNIREQKGYTYSPRSGISARPHDAYWVEAADVTTDVTGPALTEIFAEIDRLREEAPPAEELEGILNYIGGGFVMRQATPGAILNWLEFLDLHGLDASYTASYLQRVRAVTPEEVRRVAVEYLRPEEMTVAAVGDRSVIEEQLAEFGSIEVNE